jgi:hypothetical protein
MRDPAVLAHRDAMLTAAAGAHTRAHAEDLARAAALGALEGIVGTTHSSRIRETAQAVFAGLNLALRAIEERYGDA